MKPPHTDKIVNKTTMCKFDLQIYIFFMQQFLQYKMEYNNIINERMNRFKNSKTHSALQQHTTRKQTNE